MYLKEFEAKITSVKDGKFIVLNQTAFYPKSGGVDCDTGSFIRNSEKFNVVYTGKFNGDITADLTAIILCLVPVRNNSCSYIR